MIHINVVMEPKNGEEFDIVNISFLRDEIDEKRQDGKYKFIHAGSYKDRDGELHHFKGNIYAKREDNTMKIVSDILLNALEKEKEKQNEVV